MVHEKFFPYTKHCIDQEDIKGVEESLKSSLITRGEKTAQFEQDLAQHTGAKWAVTFNSATAALYAAYFAAKVGEGDRFITTPNTFVATASASMSFGSRPNFLDIELESGNISLSKMKELFSSSVSRGQFIIAPVHFAGIAVDMRKLDSMLSLPNVMVIEDAAHAIGSLYPSGEKVGSCQFSQMTVFSFHAAKTITSGEGGAVTTNDDELCHRLKLYRNNGIEKKKPYIEGQEASWYYEVCEVGNNLHMTEMQAALGLSQLKKLDLFVEKRRKLVKRYRSHFKDVPNLTLFSSEYDEHTAYHLMVLQIDFDAIKINRRDFVQALHDKGIGTQLHYIPLYHHPIVKKKARFDMIDFPNTEKYYRSAISIPLYYSLEESDVDYIAETIKSHLKS